MSVSVPIAVVWTGQDLTQVDQPALLNGEYIVLKVVPAPGSPLVQQLVAAATQLGKDLTTDPHVTPQEAIKILGLAGVLSPQLTAQLANIDQVVEPIVKSGGKMNFWTILSLVPAIAAIFAPQQGG